MLAAAAAGRDATATASHSPEGCGLGLLYYKKRMCMEGLFFSAAADSNWCPTTHFFQEELLALDENEEDARGNSLERRERL